jgi:hypothetical protein
MFSTTGETTDSVPAIKSRLAVSHWIADYFFSLTFSLTFFLGPVFSPPLVLISAK